MQELITINDPAAAAIFAAPLQSRIVETLIGSTFTLSELSALLGVPLNLLHYHVSKGIKLGLIEVVHQRQRAGRAVKHYRATAKAFFVPSELLEKMPGDHLSQAMRKALDRCQAQSVKGVNFTHDGQRPRAHLVRDTKDAAPSIELWLDIGLSSADAVAFIEEARALMDRYRTRNDDSQARYLLHVAAAKAV